MVISGHMTNKKSNISISPRSVATKLEKMAPYGKEPQIKSYMSFYSGGHVRSLDQ